MNRRHGKRRPGRPASVAKLKVTVEFVNSLDAQERWRKIFELLDALPAQSDEAPKPRQSRQPALWE